MKKLKVLLASSLVLTCLSRAEEGGTGHYIPGSMSSFMDGVPAEETFIARYNLLYYKGDIDISRPIPIAGHAAFGVDAESWANGLTMLWRPPIEMGGNWSYAMSATIPYVSTKVSATVLGREVDGSIDGIGDVVIMPLMFNYKLSADFNINARLGIYAPTGSYETGRLANAGKNFWTFEPKVGFMYLGQKNGIEASLFTGFDFNTENTATDYQTGTQFTVDATLAQHFPLFGGLAGVGANGYWYEQITGDSGAGATFGDFKGRTAGIGPVVSWTKALGDIDMITELKWIPELETRDRLQGDYLWLKVIFKF